MKPLQTYFPFGPPIGHAELPKELVNDFNKGCDDIVKDEELTNSHALSSDHVGQVEQDFLIPTDILNKWGKWLGTQVQTYVSQYFNQLYIPGQNIIVTDKSVALQKVNEIKINVLTAWYIRSFAGDFNSIHTHTGCELTCVGYLKVPDLSKEHKKHSASPRAGSTGGVLEIMGTSGSNDTAFFETDRIGFIPKVGNWYLFPANLRHGVYPFKCDGERRSFSINMNTNIFKGVSNK